MSLLRQIALFTYEGVVTGLLHHCLCSLRTVARCEIWFSTPRLTGADRLRDMDIRFFPIKHEDWHGRRMTYKLEQLLHLPFARDDNVLVCDLDLSFKQNPFGVFHNNFDLFYTTRGYHCAAPVNGGVFGFKWTLATERLIQFLVAQKASPSWPALISVQKELNALRLGNRAYGDWWFDQDLLCALHRDGPPVPAVVFDAGELYNLTPQSGGGRPLTANAKDEFVLRALSDPNVVVVHFKELKNDPDVLCRFGITV